MSTLESEVLSGNIENRLERLIGIVISDMAHISRACSSRFRKLCYKELAKYQALESKVKLDFDSPIDGSSGHVHSDG